MNQIVRALACASLFGLSACFLSEQPLITGAESQHPLPAGEYLARGADEPDGGDRFSVSHAGPDTLVQEAGDDEPSVLRFRELDDTTYVMQSAEDGVYLYGALRTRDGGAEIWLAQCEDLTDAERRRIGVPMQNDECLFGDWDALAEALALVVERLPPDTIFTRIE